MKKVVLAAILGIVLSVAASIQLCAQTAADAGVTFKSKVDAILNVATLASAYEGVEIETVKDKQVLYSRNAGRVFLPASNNKLLTSSAALALLGADFQYRTELKAIGTVANGTLTGDLLLVGSGDPTLSSEDVATMASQVRAAGISTITGGIRYDASVFDEQWLGDGWTWDDEPYYYSAQIGGLNVDRNVTLVTVKPAAKAENQPIVTLTAGAEACIKVENTAVTRDGENGDTKPHIAIDRKRGENIITVTGTIPVDSSAKPVTAALTFENPPMYTATLFLEALKRAGITVGTNTAFKWNSTTPDGSALATHSSAKLSDIIALMNKPSDNMIAECLLKTIGAFKRKIGTAGGSGTGPASAREWLTSIGLEPMQLHQVDGSGLSRQDFVSPLNLVRLLRYWTTDSKYSTFYSSLPIAGVDGTLRNRMKGTAAANNCRAKTGSLNHVSCLSGYVTSKDGVPLVFSIMLNNQLGPAIASTNAENKIVELLADTEIGAHTGSEIKAQ